MARVVKKSLQQAEPELSEVYQKIEKKFGKVPNIFLNMGNSLAALKGFLALSEQTEKMTLAPKLREQIALAVSQENDCNYCLAAHCAASKQLGLEEQQVMHARQAQAEEKREDAILKFAKLVVEKNGRVSGHEVEELKKAGVNDQEMVEIIYLVMGNMFTNYFNHITDPDIDFPIAKEIALEK